MYAPVPSTGFGPDRLSRYDQKIVLSRTGSKKFQTYITHGLPQKALYQFNRKDRIMCHDHLMDLFQPMHVPTSSAVSIKLPRNQSAWVVFSALRCSNCGHSIIEGDKRRTGCWKSECDCCIPISDVICVRAGPDRSIAGTPIRIVHGNAIKFVDGIEKKVPIYFSYEGNSRDETTDSTLRISCICRPSLVWKNAIRPFS